MPDTQDGTVVVLPRAAVEAHSFQVVAQHLDAAVGVGQLLENHKIRALAKSDGIEPARLCEAVSGRKQNLCYE